MEYQGRTFAPILNVVKDRKIISILEKKLKDGERLVIDTKFAPYKGEGYDKYSVYAFRGKKETPRFLTCVDLYKLSGRCRVN